ncbi:PREDICTED: testis-expressed sequence 12 protein [Nanorana parkeri]|uniref:testis-expressed sequence 12 protein n=1 Tax=Nanorana parkeri TaxID=125878 RepID=UPI0008544528|nr:PREDICTED: testis-expressed sequence 12 protein [Nanorana parkeri]
MASTASQDESKSSKRKKDMEVLDSEMLQCALPSKEPSSYSEISQGGDTDALVKDLRKEINLILLKFAKILSELSAVDVRYVDEFDDILKEARSLETQLKQKRESLRNQLTMIANTLQR